MPIPNIICETSESRIDFQRVLKEEAVFARGCMVAVMSYKQNQMADLEYRLGNRLLKELQLQIARKK